ncbi:MAG TPA: hypothetical protein VFF49_11160 [Thermodesulfobacteriota bacterium]|nr:hypothetical protein [Thermodesulfobacteriota bacterium]
MPKHQKPSKEELQEKEQEAIEEAEKLEASIDETEPSEPIPSEPAPSEPQEESEEAEPSKEVKEKLKIEVAEKNKKLSASAREAQKLYAKNRVINKALIDAEETPEPTEEDLQKEFKDWDVMSDTERTFAKETVISRNWRKTISQAKEQATKIERWNDSVNEFIGDPKTLIDSPELEGKTNEFESFAKEESNNSVPFKVLVGAFLHEQSTNSKPHKGRMFENGSGGPNDKPQPKSDTITLEEARKLRETDYNKYKEYLIAGKIKSDL